MVIEKDFWVCWILKRLFSLTGIPELRFKGGTSLSKVYRLIERFSEDIDVSLNRSALGFFGDKDPANPKHSKSKRKHQNEKLSDAIKHAVENQILPSLKSKVESELGPTGWQLKLSTEAADDEMTLQFEYPVTIDYGASYIRPIVRIEFGRGDQHPSERKLIMPYVAEEFPKAFTDPTVPLDVLTCERTFIEKITLLHAEFHLTSTRRLKPRMSRHWHDVAVMSTDPRFAYGNLDIQMLKEVIAFKMAYFQSTSAKYETALPGTLRIVPHEDLQKMLKEDYAQMQVMFGGKPMSFEEMMSRLRSLEERINVRRQSGSQCSSHRQADSDEAKSGPGS